MNYLSLHIGFIFRILCYLGMGLVLSWFLFSTYSFGDRADVGSSFSPDRDKIIAPDSYDVIDGEAYSLQEIVDAGHHFFGETTGSFARLIEYVFNDRGAPNAFIIGEEVSGAFLGGLRYGEGEIFLKSGGRQKVYWQGPSLGFDLGANGSRTMTLVYNMKEVDDIYDRHTGVEGSLYAIGGFGVNYQRGEKLVLAPIRTGIGARAGVNIGYLKYTSEPDWNPF